MEIKNKEESEAIGLSEQVTKKEKKQKGKKINKQEEELNKQFFENLKVGEEPVKKHYEDNRKGGYHKKGHQKKGNNGEKFHFNEEDFPQL